MTSVRAAAAIAVVAVIVVAGCAYALFGNGGGGDDRDSPVTDAIGSKVEVGDFYVLGSESSAGYTAAAADMPADTTRHEVVAIDGDLLTVEKTTSSGAVSEETMTADEFLDDVSVVDEALIGQYLRNETITTPMGTVDCAIYVDIQQVGNATTVTAYDWVGIGTNIIYRTEIALETSISSERYTTTLCNTNMIQQGGSSGAVVPDVPQTGSSPIRTDLEVGDYIEFSKREGNDRDYERVTITAINGDTVYYVEHDDDDRERTTRAGFLALVQYSGGGTLQGTETISTVFGDIECNVYEVDSRYTDVLDLDWEDRNLIWASVSDGTIYKIEIQDDHYDDDDDWDDWHDDTESYYLTGTSLMGAAGGSSGGQPEPTPSEESAYSDRYGVSVSIGDTYTITEDDGYESETYTVVSIANGYLTVTEVDERGYSEIERMSVNEFLGEILITADQLQRWYRDTGSTHQYDGRVCQVYQEIGDDDCIAVTRSGDNYIIWADGELDRSGNIRDADLLTHLGVASIDGSTGGDGPSQDDPSQGDDPAPGTGSAYSDRYGVTVNVGDSYTIFDDDGRDTDTYTVTSISGGYLTVTETDERGGTDTHRKSVDEFLADILITADQLQRGYRLVEQSYQYEGMVCQVYAEYGDDDCLVVTQSGDNYIIWADGEWNGRNVVDAEHLVQLDVDV